MSIQEEKDKLLKDLEQETKIEEVAAVARVGKNSNNGEDKLTKIASLLEQVVIGQKNLNDRVAELEKKPDEKFKAVNEPEDVKEFNSKLSSEFREILYEILGKDFKATYDMNTNMFTVIVPKRLSWIKPVMIPKVVDGKYVKDEGDHAVLVPKEIDDLRTKVVFGQLDVKDWCNKIKTNILNHYKESGLPTPRFNV